MDERADPPAARSAARTPRERGGRAGRPRPRFAGADGDGTTRLFIGGGRQIGLRPADIVGAIANEAGVAGRAIGAIEIADRFALVEVPSDAADDIVRSLNAASIRGRRLPVRRDR